MRQPVLQSASSQLANNSTDQPRVPMPTCPLTRFFLKNPPPLHLTPPQQPQPFRMPGKTESQPEDDQRQARREGQGNGDQARDDQDRSRDRPGRLDDTQHAFKVAEFPAAQLAPSLLPRVGTRRRTRPLVSS